MKVSRSDFEMVKQIDEDPYTYLDDLGDDWRIGIRAKIMLKIPSRQGGYYLQTISSPGLWGIESDSDDEYLQDVFEEECHTLQEMLEGMGIEVVKNAKTK